MSFPALHPHPIMLSAGADSVWKDRKKLGTDAVEVAAFQGTDLLDGTGSQASWKLPSVSDAAMVDPGSPGSPTVRKSTQSTISHQTHSE